MIDPESFPSATATLNGIEYFYIDQPAMGKTKNTVVLVHGWPDSWYGWRHQIAYLSSQGYRVLCPSQLGYGAGTASPGAVESYTLKNVCADLAALLEVVGVGRAYFFGHDWGGSVVFRMANHFPKKVLAVLSLSTPYFAPAKGKFLSLEGQAKLLPNFRYQVYLASDQPTKDFAKPDEFRKFFMRPGKGMKLQFEEIASASGEEISATPLLSREEVEVYVRQYSAAGLGHSTNWYRTRRMNYDDDRALLREAEARTGGSSSDAAVKLAMPVLFIATELDPVLRPEMSKGMEKHCAKLTRASVKTGHWGLVEAKDEVNAIVGEFLMRLEFEKMRHQI